MRLNHRFNIPMLSSQYELSDSTATSLFLRCRSAKLCEEDSNNPTKKSKVNDKINQFYFCQKMVERGVHLWISPHIVSAQEKYCSGFLLKIEYFRPFKRPSSKPSSVMFCD